jgi:hypothetical protein
MSRSCYALIPWPLGAFLKHSGNLDVFKDFLSERRHGALATLHEGVPPEKVLLRILTKTARSVNLATAIAST